MHRMTWLLVALALTAAAHGAVAEKDSTAIEPGEKNDSLFKLRLSGGLGAMVIGYAQDARVLVGPRNSNLRIGAQAMWMQEMNISVYPQETRALWSGIVGWEVSRPHWLSIMPFAGGGFADCQLRGKLQEGASQENLHEMESWRGPAAVTGVDVGVSLHRTMGISVQVGMLYSKRRTGYAVLQLDVGSW